MCGFQTVNFCHSSYIISLGGSRFFCYGQEENLELEKEVYISIDMKSQKSQGLGFKSRLPGTRYLYWGSSFGRGGNFLQAEAALSSTYLPLLFQVGWQPCPVCRWGQCSPLWWWADLQLRQTTRAALAWSPSFLAFSERSQIEKQSLRSYLQCSFLIHIISRKRKTPNFPHTHNSKACLTF